MAANWCSGPWRAWLVRVGRSRVGAILLSAGVALASTHCIADFLATPRGAGGPPGAPPQPRLVFVVQPGGGVSGYPLDTIAVAAVDSAGRPASPTIILELLGGSGSAILEGARQRLAADGVAAFGGLVVDSAGS